MKHNIQTINKENKTREKLHKVLSQQLFQDSHNLYNNHIHKEYVQGDVYPVTNPDKILQVS